MENGFFGNIDKLFINHLPSALLLCLFLVAFGVGLGKLLGPLLKDFFGRGSLNVTLADHEDKSGTPRRKLCIPEECPDHKAEKERSLRNEEEINRLWKQHSALRQEIMEKLGKIERGNQRILLALVSKGKLNVRDVSSEEDG